MLKKLNAWIRFRPEQGRQTVRLFSQQTVTLWRNYVEAE